jgi:hypothetical protein
VSAAFERVRGQELFTLSKTVHASDFYQNIVACASAQAKGLQVNIFVAHSGNEFANILLDGLRGCGVVGWIENLKQPEDIIFVFLDRLAVDLFAAPCAFGQVRSSHARAFKAMSRGAPTVGSPSASMLPARMKA